MKYKLSLQASIQITSKINFYKGINIYKQSINHQQMDPNVKIMDQSQS